MSEFSVFVNKVNLSYDKDVKILNDTTIRVERGSIYGLLGPSGSGKTTLLKCILNLIKPDSGDIRIFGYQPGTKDSGVPGPGVGFMPQEVSLYQDLSIKEFLYYFGKISLLTTEEINYQINYLLEVLFNPNENIKVTKVIKMLSGGQQRRISLAATLIHEPRLLILDEPTVGVDPFVANKIWLDLARRKKELDTTIIMTTHYISEAKSADTVAFMMNGHILEEASPQEVMTKYNKKTLESVFYEIVVKKKKMANGIVDPIRCCSKDDSRNRRLAVEPFIPKKKMDMNHFWFSIFATLVWKTSLQLIRHPEFIIVIMMVPIMNLISDKVVIKPVPDNLGVVVINEDNSPFLSKIFLGWVRKDILNLKYDNLSGFDEAIKSVKRRENYAVLHIKQNFSTGLIRKVYFNDVEDEDDEYWIENTNSKDLPILEASTMMLYCDMTSYIVKETIETTLKFALNYSFPDVMMAAGKNPKMKVAPRKLERAIRGSYKLDDIFGINDTFIIGLMAFLCYYTSLIMGFLSFYNEKMNDMFIRNQVANITKFNVAFSILVPNLVLSTIQSVIDLSIGVNLFGVAFEGSLIVVMVIFTLLAISGILLGIFVSFFVLDLYGTVLYSMVFLSGIFCWGGAFWPYESIPMYMRPISLSLPSTWAFLGANSVMVYDLPITNKKVYQPILVISLSIIILLVCIAKATPINRRQA